MALIAIGADKGSPGVTTTSVALAAVWPRPVLLAECDPAGGDLVYRLPGPDGALLDSRRGLLSLAVAARHGLQPQHVWEHSQKLGGGLDLLAGVTSAEQGVGFDALWGQLGSAFSSLPGADVIVDCGRIGVEGPLYDLLAHSAEVVLVTRARLGEVVRLRERIGALAAALPRRGWSGNRIGVMVVAGHKEFRSAVGEVTQALAESGHARAGVLGGIAYDPKSAEALSGEWGVKLDRSLLIRTARALAGRVAAALPEPAAGEAPMVSPPVARPPVTRPPSAAGAPILGAAAPGPPVPGPPVPGPSAPIPSLAGPSLAGPSAVVPSAPPVTAANGSHHRRNDRVQQSSDRLAPQPLPAPAWAGDALADSRSRHSDPRPERGESPEASRLREG